MQQLKDKLRSKDLSREDPSTFVPLLTELTQIKNQLDDKENELNQLSKSIKFLKNKHGGVDIEQKFNTFKVKAQDLAKRLAA